MPLIDVIDLTKTFDRSTYFARRSHPAIDRVSFSIEEGECFGLVGGSGSGKTTAGRCMLRLIEPTSGSVLFRDEDDTFHFLSKETYRLKQY